jgi:PAS domain S-box-containing protein
VLIAQPQALRYVNDAVSVITGYGREELLRMQVWELVHPDERAAAMAKATARMRGEPVSPRSEYRLVTKSGESRWVDITVTTIELDGEPALLGAAFDVTERKLAEQALRASEARYRGLVESQREIVLRFDANGHVTFANDAYCDTYGVRREDAIGQPFWPLVYPDDVEALRAAVEATMRPPYRGHVETRSRTGGGWRWFEWDASGIRDGQGVVVEGQAAGRDITERRRAQDDLRTSLEDLRRSEERLRLLAQRQVAIREEERKRLSFDLHDDVCQELVGVGILVGSALGRLESAPPETTAALTRATGYLSEVVEHLRLLARDLRPMLLQDLGLEGSFRSLAAGFSSQETTVQAVFPTPIPRLDEEVEVAVYRVAQEAITNAIRHAAARRVTVTLTVGRDSLHLEVQDDGCGFDVAQREIQAFGLTSMAERAQALGGRFTLQSRGGEGTIVRLECPRIERSATAA